MATGWAPTNPLAQREALRLLSSVATWLYSVPGAYQGRHQLSQVLNGVGVTRGVNGINQVGQPVTAYRNSQNRLTGNCRPPINGERHTATEASLAEAPAFSEAAALQRTVPGQPQKVSWPCHNP